MLYLKNKILVVLNNILDNLKGKCIQLDILGIMLKQKFKIYYGNIIIEKKTISLNIYIKKIYGNLKSFIINYTNYSINENIVY